MRALAIALVVLAGVVTPRVASADIVRLTTGATLSVKSATAEGDTMVLLLRGGGEVRTPKALVAEVLPDEVLHAEAASTIALPGYEAPKAPATLPELIDALAERIGVPADLAHALITVESNYQPTAVSPKGAMGLMQLMPATARQYAVTDPFDPEQNLTAGAPALPTKGCASTRASACRGSATTLRHVSCCCSAAWKNGRPAFTWPRPGAGASRLRSTAPCS